LVHIITDTGFGIYFLSCLFSTESSSRKMKSHNIFYGAKKLRDWS